MDKVSYSNSNRTVIRKAAELLQENANELKDAFQLSNGNFLAEDTDIQIQIREIESVADDLRRL